jgi:hypothetical protein
VQHKFQNWWGTGPALRMHNAADGSYKLLENMNISLSIVEQKAVSLQEM